MEAPTKGTSFGPIFRWVMAVVVTVASLGAQTSRGTLTGIVTDAQGAAMAGAQVSLMNESTNVRRTTTANEAGLYRFDAVDAAPHDPAELGPAMSCPRRCHRLVEEHRPQDRRGAVEGVALGHGRSVRPVRSAAAAGRRRHRDPQDESAIRGPEAESVEARPKRG